MVIVLRSIHRVEKKHIEEEKATEMFKCIFEMTVTVFADMFLQREYDL